MCTCFYGNRVLSFTVLVLHLLTGTIGDGLFYSPKNFSLNPEVLPSVIEFNCYYMKTQGFERTYTYSWDLNGKFYERTDNFTRQVEVYNPSIEGDYTCNALTGGQRQGEITVTLRLPVVLDAFNSTPFTAGITKFSITCSQIGYLRTMYWTFNGQRMDTGVEGRREVSLSSRTKLTSSAHNNFQNTSFCIRYPRMSDSGTLSCAVEDGYTEPLTYNILFAPPQGYTVVENGTTVSSYEVMQGVEQFADFIYDGEEGESGILTGGRGQLADGWVGGALDSLNEAKRTFAWVGWQEQTVEILFKFDGNREFSSVNLHTYFSYSGTNLEVIAAERIDVSVFRSPSTEGQVHSYTLTANDKANGDFGFIHISTTNDQGQPIEGDEVRCTLKRPVSASGTAFVLLSEVTFNSTAKPIITPKDPGSPTVALGIGVAVGAVIIIVLAGVIVFLIWLLVKQRERASDIYARIIRRKPPPLPAANGHRHQESTDIYSQPNELPILKAFTVSPNKLVSNDTYDRPEEYSMVARTQQNRITSITSTDKLPELPRPRFTSSPPKVSPPKRQSASAANNMFNIYARPGSIREEQEKLEDIYSEPYDLSTFAVEKPPPLPPLPPHPNQEELLETPYSSVYAMPALLEQWEGPTEVTAASIKEIQVLGVGQFGEVVLAETVGLSRKDLRLDSSDDDKNVSVLVAVKKLKGDSRRETQESFEKEIRFMSRLTHKNVICLLAICLEDTPFIIMEYMEDGDLNQYLKKREYNPHAVSYANTLDQNKLMDISLQVASGMEYLACHKFIHRDLATRNCLVGKTGVVKIADFGMSQNLYSSYYFILKGRAVLPIRWMAYECFFGKFSVKTDVWAFGVTLWEIFTLCKEQPYERWTDQEVIRNAIKPSKGDKSEVLPNPNICPAEVYQLMVSCWCFEPDERPTFTTICKTLDELTPII